MDKETLKKIGTGIAIGTTMGAGGSQIIDNPKCEYTLEGDGKGICITLEAKKAMEMKLNNPADFGSATFK